MTRSVLLHSGIETSRIGFGASRLHYLPRHDRNKLLAAAFEFGIRHFDTAPAYGDGLAESSLAPLLAGRRDKCVVATKYGVPPDPVLSTLPAISPIWRPIRSVVRRVGLAKPTLPLLTASGLLRSVEDSLRRLKTDYVDILLLHEPSVVRLTEARDLIDQLICLRAEGKIRTFGVAGKWIDLEAILAGDGSSLGEVIQTGEDEWVAGRPPDITYGAISQGSQSYFQASISSSEAERRLLNALNRRLHGVVLVSTTKLENLKRLTKLAGDPGL